MVLRSIAAIVCSLACVLVTRAALADQLTTLDGQQLSGQISAIDESGRLSGEGLPADLSVDGLRKIEREVTSDSAPGKVVLELLGGGRILGESITIENEKFHVAWSLGDKLVLPIDVVRAVRFRPTVNDASFEDALAKPSADHDRLFVDVDGKLAVLTGLVESLSADNVVFQYEGQQQTLATSKLFGIVVAQVGKAGKDATGVTVELAQGSRLSGAIKSLKDERLTLTVGPTTVDVPWSGVKSLAVRSSRLAFLSDLDPIEVEESRIVTLPQPWQRDKNVNRKTIMLGERQFERGIGTHASSKLTFDLAGNFDVFSATIGIDSSTDRKGDCVFVVLADGSELARERMTGTSEPKQLKLDVARVKQLALVVEPGEDLDLADVANWADARVYKQK